MGKNKASTLRVLAFYDSNFFLIVSLFPAA
jgi:hypothetical protein